MRDTGPDAAYGARLLAFALSTSALIGLVTSWAHRRAIASLASNEGFSEKLFAYAGQLGNGEVACELLLAGFILVGAHRYGRGVGDRRTHNLSLGAGIFLAVDAVRAVGFNLDVRWFDPDLPAPDRQARMQLWMLAALVLRLGGLGLLTAALARGQRLVDRTRAWWPLVVASLLTLYPLALWLGRPEGPPSGNNLVDWLPLILTLATLTIAGAAVHQAGRIDTGPLAAAWARAADGLERYRDATALRVLAAASVGGFVVLARVGGFTPMVTLGGLCVLGMVGPLIGLFQIAGLARVADAPVARLGLGLALPLLGVGLAAECATLLPLAGFVLGGGRDTGTLRDLDLAGLGAQSQMLGLLTALILLLSLRHLARACAARSALARVDALLIAFAALVALGLGAYWIFPTLRLHHDATQLLVLGLAFSLLCAAIWMLVVYMRLLKELAEAMTQTSRLTAGSP